MAKPADLDWKVPLSYDGDGEGAGWVAVKIHIDDMDELTPADQQFLLDLLDRVNAFVKNILCPKESGT